MSSTSPFLHKVLHRKVYKPGSKRCIPLQTIFIGQTRVSLIASESAAILPISRLLCHIQDISLFSFQSKINGDTKSSSKYLPVKLVTKGPASKPYQMGWLSPHSRQLQVTIPSYNYCTSTPVRRYERMYCWFPEWHNHLWFYCCCAQSYNSCWYFETPVHSATKWINRSGQCTWGNFPNGRAA